MFYVLQAFLTFYSLSTTFSPRLLRIMDQSYVLPLPPTTSESLEIRYMYQHARRHADVLTFCASCNR